MKDLIVIPQLKHSIVASINNATITEIVKINILMDSKSIITENNLIVSLCYDAKTLHIHNMSGDLLFSKEDSTYKSLNCRNNIVYFFGGNMNMIQKTTLWDKERFFQ